MIFVMDRFYIRFASVTVVLLLLGTSVGEEVDGGNEKVYLVLLFFLFRILVI